MAALLHKTGKVLRCNPGSSYNGMQLVPQMILERDDGSKVELHDVAIEEDVFARIDIGKSCTIVFYNRLL